jgi:hypothetical protein
MAKRLLQSRLNPDWGILRPEGVLPKLAISTDLFQKVGVFFSTAKRPSIHHVFTSNEPRFYT